MIFLGTIPNFLPKSMRDLDLSINSISGVIPAAIQTKGDLANLDLSSNRLSGLLTDFAVIPRNYKNFTLKLSVNRLSGNIPTSIRNLHVATPCDPKSTLGYPECYHVDILDGNLFGCETTAAAEFPPNDLNYNTVQCGSDTFSNAMYLFAAASVIIVSILLLVYVFSRLSNGEVKEGDGCFTKIVAFWSRRWSSIQLWKHPFETEDANIYPESVVVFFNNLVDMRIFSMKATALIVFVFVPLYPILKKILNYGTHTYQYAFLYSGAFFKGTTVTAILFAAWTILLFIIRYFITVTYRKPFEKESLSIDPMLKNKKCLMVFRLFILTFINGLLSCTVNIAYVFLIDVRVPRFDVNTINIIKLALAVYKVLVCPSLDLTCDT